MASLSLSVLKIVVEVMFYGIFPIIAVIAVLPGGFSVVKKYVIALFWIQSWAPLYSILNMLVNIYGRAKSMGAVTGTASSALSMATLPGLAEANEWVRCV
jgi:conjugal transfer mating pair stabilization protein TraG